MLSLSLMLINRKTNVNCNMFNKTGEPSVLDVTPNSSWPDTVYYNSYTRVNTGWKIHIVDSFNLPVTSNATKKTDIFIKLIILLHYFLYYSV